MFQLVHMAAPVKMRTLFHCVSALHDINGPMLDMLQDITTQRCKDWGGELMEFNGEADHVHALLSLPTNLDLSRFVNKTTSSRLVRREYARQLSRVYRKPAILLRHLVRRRAAVRAQAIRGAARCTGVSPRFARGGLHPQTVCPLHKRGDSPSM